MKKIIAVLIVLTAVIFVPHIPCSAADVMECSDGGEYSALVKHSDGKGYSVVAENSDGTEYVVFSCGDYAIEAGQYIITSDVNGIKARYLRDNSVETLVYEDDFKGGSLVSDGVFLFYTDSDDTSSGGSINQIYLDGTEHTVLVETGKNPKLLGGMDMYLYYTDYAEQDGFMEQRLNIYDLEAGQIIKSIPNVNNVKIYNGHIYFHIARFDPEPVKFFVADLDGKHKKCITKKYCDSSFTEEGIYFLDFMANQKVRLSYCGLTGENKTKIGRAFQSDLVLYMGRDYSYYIRTINEKNYLYAYHMDTGVSNMLNSTDGYFSVTSSDEGILYLRNTKTGLMFIMDGVNFSPTRTKIKGTVNIIGIYQGYIYYSKLDANGEVNVKRKVLK